MERIALTDDEAVACAVTLGGAWPTLLPSLDVASADTLLAACARGMRALGVRDLLKDADGPVSLTPDLEEIVEPIVNGGSLFACFVAGDDGAVITNGMALYGYTLGGDRAVLHVISSAGVHHLSVASAADAHLFVSAVATDAYTSGIVPPEGAEPRADAHLRVTGPLGDSVNIVAIGKGSIEAFSQAGGGDPIPTSTQPESLEEALKLIA